MYKRLEFCCCYCWAFLNEMKENENPPLETKKKKKNPINTLYKNYSLLYINSSVNRTFLYINKIHIYMPYISLSYVDNKKSFTMTELTERRRVVRMQEDLNASFNTE